jgi:hypothetical protein
MNRMARESWTDERLDDLKERVDDGFRRMDEQLARVDGRLDSIQHAIVFGAVTLSGTMVAGFVAMFGLILTQT